MFNSLLPSSEDSDRQWPQKIYMFYIQREDEGCSTHKKTASLEAAEILWRPIYAFGIINHCRCQLQINTLHSEHSQTNQFLYLYQPQSTASPIFVLQSRQFSINDFLFAYIRLMYSIIKEKLGDVMLLNLKMEICAENILDINAHRAMIPYSAVFLRSIKPSLDHIMVRASALPPHEDSKILMGLLSSLLQDHERDIAQLFKLEMLSSNIAYIDNSLDMLLASFRKLENHRVARLTHSFSCPVFGKLSNTYSH